MKCPSCGYDGNAPISMYCEECAHPLEFGIEEIREDEEKRYAAKRVQDAVEQAKGLFVLGLFFLATVFALRLVLLKDQPYDHPPAYRIPYTVAEELAQEPPVALDVTTIEIPIPEEE